MQKYQYPYELDETATEILYSYTKNSDDFP